MLGDLVFLVFAALTIGCAVAVAFARSVFTSSLALVATLLGTVGLYAHLGSGFAALTQLLLFAGGSFALVLVAVVFVPHAADLGAVNRSAHTWLALLTAVTLGSLLASVALATTWVSAPPAGVAAPAVGLLLFGPALLPLLLASVILLTATAGALVLARKEWRDE